MWWCKLLKIFKRCKKRFQNSVLGFYYKVVVWFELILVWYAFSSGVVSLWFNKRRKQALIFKIRSKRRNSNERVAIEHQILLGPVRLKKFPKTSNFQRGAFPTLKFEFRFLVCIIINLIP